MTHHEKAAQRATRAQALRKEGLTVAQIAERLGVAWWTVWPWLRWSGVGPIHKPRKQKNREAA
jgi:transcriptional regulator with XRE-family HTH domain